MVSNRPASDTYLSTVDSKQARGAGAYEADSKGTAEKYGRTKISTGNDSLQRVKFNCKFVVYIAYVRATSP